MAYAAGSGAFAFWFIFWGLAGVSFFDWFGKTFPSKIEKPLPPTEPLEVVSEPLETQIARSEDKLVGRRPVVTETSYGRIISRHHDDIN